MVARVTRLVAEKFVLSTFPRALTTLSSMCLRAVRALESSPGLVMMMDNIAALGPVANTDTKLLIYGLFQKGRVLAQDGDGAGLRFSVSLGDSSVSSDRGDTVESTEANRERHDTGRNEERTGALAS